MKNTKFTMGTAFSQSFQLLHISLFLVFIFILSGCASYKAALLQTLQPEFAPYSETIDNVTLSCKTLSNEECKLYFNRNIIQEGYQPVKISIKNDTKRHMLFSSQGVSLPVHSPQEVAARFHTRFIGLDPKVVDMAKRLAQSPLSRITWPFWAPVGLADMADTFGTLIMNAKIDMDFNELNLENLVIKPYAKHSGVIFISNNDFQDSFLVRLVDKKSNEKFEYYVKGSKGSYSGEKPSSEQTATESFANESSTVIVNPAEPWTGKWEVDGSSWGNWVMKQNGKIVKCTTCERYFKGKVEGNQLKGRWGKLFSPMVLKMSSDGMSFEGIMSELADRYNVKGKRIE